MPSSRPNIIPTVIHLLQQLNPQSILDVGVGFGKWGHLFREYTDIHSAENNPARYQRQNWKIRIDGLEGNPAYLTDLHRYVYNDIHIGDACQVIRALGSYDLIFAGDVIEHFDKEAGVEFLKNAFDRANKAVILSTPKYDTEQADLCGNELERHRSLWRAKDFQHFAGAIVKTIDRDTLLVVLPKPGAPELRCTPPMMPGRREQLQIKRVKENLIRLVPLDEAFIFVDESLRSLLPHSKALPFLERDGQDWGPPADDTTAIAELERMRQAGAKYIAFAWTSYWWFGHYTGFAKHLGSCHRCVFDSESVKVYSLQSQTLND